MKQSLWSPEFPFSPRAFPVFYGWVILIVSTLGVAMSIPGQTMGVGVFTDYLIEELGLNRFQISTSYMLGTITSAFILPYGGRFFDRYGARITIVGSAILLAVVLVYMSQCDRIADVLSLGGSINAFLVAFVVSYCGFTLLRFSGQGMLAMTGRAVLGKWFDHHRGLVSGLSSMLVTFLFSVAPAIFHAMIQATDWRTTWILLSAVSIGMAMLGYLTYRDSPEECGLTMDGLPPHQHSEENEDPPHIQHEYTLPEARMSTAFWVFSLGLAMQGLVVTAMTFHITSLGASKGLSNDESLQIFIPTGFVAIASTMIVGWLCDRVDLRWILASMMLFLASGVFGLLNMDQQWSYVLVTIGFGISNGFFNPLMTVVWPKYYGRKHLGAISSFNLSLLVFASAIGPNIFAIPEALFDSYDVGIYICLVMPVLVAGLSWFADNPQRHVAPDLEG